jgi:hypothetical protein
VDEPLFGKTYTQRLPGANWGALRGARPFEVLEFATAAKRGKTALAKRVLASILPPL